MSTPPLDPEEAAVSAVFAELGRPPGGESTRVTSAEDDVEEVLRRLDLEAIGLVGWGLELQAPPPALRERLLERLSGDSTQEVGPAGGAPADLFAGDDTQAVASLEELEAEAAAGATERQVPPAEAPGATPVLPGARRAPDLSDTAVPFPARLAARRPSRWAKTLAAVLGFLAIGLGTLAAWLASELSSAQVRVARLEAEVGRLGREDAAERAALAARLAELERRRDFAAGQASVVFALRAPVGSPQPLARGKLWLAADHRHWQLETTGLAPTPAGREYQVWFVVDELPMSGGCFAVAPGASGELGDSTMPAGTSEVRVTLERAGGAPSPSTPVLLVADQAVEL